MRQRKEKYINNLNNEYKAKIAKQHKVLDFQKKTRLGLETEKKLMTERVAEEIKLPEGQERDFMKTQRSKISELYAQLQAQKVR